MDISKEKLTNYYIIIDKNTTKEEGKMSSLLFLREFIDLNYR